MMILRKGLMWIGCLLMATGPVWGATFNGRLTTSAYSWRVQELTGVDARHVRFYQTAILNVGQMGDQALSFHTHLQFSGDLADEISGREHYRIYSAYAQLQPQKMGIDVRLGRQRVFGGVGFGTIDGVWASVSPQNWLLVNGYAGILAPLVPDDGIGTWDEGHLWGGQAQVNFDQTFVTVSYAERSRQPLAYLGAGRYSRLTLKNDGKQFRRLGFDARHEMKQVSLYARLDVDAENWDVQELEMSGDVKASQKLQVSASFQHRTPTLYLNSIFSVFEVSNDREIDLGVNYQVADAIRVLLHGSRVFFDGDKSWDIGAGVGVGNGYVGYTRRIGYGGNNDAIMASVQQPFREKITLRADGSLSSYRLFDGQVRRDRAMAGTLGMRYQHSRAAMLDVEFQMLRNAFYNRDARVFVRGSLWFFKRR